MEKGRFCPADLFDCGQVATFYCFSESISAVGHRYSSVTRYVQKGEKHWPPNADSESKKDDRTMSSKSLSIRAIYPCTPCLGFA